MYSEHQIKRKKDECLDLLLVWKELWDVDNDNKETKNARQKWCQCVTEHGEMVSHEVKTNPRYTSIRKI